MVYTIDGRKVRSFDDFIAAVNLGFIRHLKAEWDGNLDAFNDFLSWGEPEFQIDWLGSAECRRHLGHQAQAAWLRAKLTTCHPANVSSVETRLALAETDRGETLFDVIEGIILDNPQVKLVLR